MKKEEKVNPWIEATDIIIEKEIFLQEKIGDIRK